uniref:Uncharacterized protein n=1 Tax=Anguilla anguilla TaxID=7936 RepID=A0A0E9VSK0_ANGAN
MLVYGDVTLFERGHQVTKWMKKATFSDEGEIKGVVRKIG